MSKSQAVNLQAIDIAYNIVLAQIVVAKLQASHCGLIRTKVCEILGRSSRSVIMEARAARVFDSLNREAQLLVLASAISSIHTPQFAEFRALEWSQFKNPLALPIDVRDIHQARKLYFQWQGLALAPCGAREYLHENWLLDAPPAGLRKIGSPRRLALGHA